ncbi:MAG: ribosome small subunit-dependent GTPase A [Betaproteobacteria bacterium]|nr:ribosome small subunit-dependent GTPase A [Betaproteobacteria bacterium]
MASSENNTLHGLIVETFRRHYTVALDNSDRLDCVLKGRDTTLVCGDEVELARTGDGSSGVITALKPRQNLFYRSDAIRQKRIAANVTQILGVVAPDIALDEMLLNRWIVAAEAAHCRFVLIANKRDLPGFSSLRERLKPYEALGYPVIETCAKSDVAALWPHLEQQKSVLIGQSGMGKSTLINALFPNARSETAAVSKALGSGKHTTTFAALHLLAKPHAGWIIDIPGMKVFGLAHLTPDELTAAFKEIAPLVGHCRFRDCRHDKEPGCAVQKALHEGRLHPKRLELLQTLIRESAY